MSTKKTEFPDFKYDMHLVEWDAVEYHPVRDLTDGACETIDDPNEEHEADFWSVYVHNVDAPRFGALTCIADFKTKDEAEGFAWLLEALMPKLCRYPHIKK